MSPEAQECSNGGVPIASGAVHGNIGGAGLRMGGVRQMEQQDLSELVRTALESWRTARHLELSGQRSVEVINAYQHALACAFRAGWQAAQGGRGAAAPPEMAGYTELEAEWSAGYRHQMNAGQLSADLPAGTDQAVIARAGRAGFAAAQAGRSPELPAEFAGQPRLWAAWVGGYDEAQRQILLRMGNVLAELTRAVGGALGLKGTPHELAPWYRDAQLLVASLICRKPSASDDELLASLSLPDADLAQLLAGTDAECLFYREAAPRLRLARELLDGYFDF